MSQERAQAEVQISVSDSHLAEFGKVVKQLEAAGLHVDQQLDGIGVVTGHVDPDQIKRLERVTGVQGVERSRKVGIPPGELDS
jgi:hypothetical protein